jgi:hypothetical protein
MQFATLDVFSVFGDETQNCPVFVAKSGEFVCRASGISAYFSAYSLSSFCTINPVSWNAQRKRRVKQFNGDLAGCDCPLYVISL